jgi:hypothetical protein
MNVYTDRAASEYRAIASEHYLLDEQDQRTPVSV